MNVLIEEKRTEIKELIPNVETVRITSIGVQILYKEFLIKRNGPFLETITETKTRVINFEDVDYFDLIEVIK